MLIIYEIIAWIFFLGLFGFLGLLILPTLFGCVGFILFWVIVLALIIFFSFNLLWFILAGIVIYGVLGINKYLRYLRLPNYDAYLVANPNIFHDGVLHCKYCGSENLFHRGVFTTRSKYRYYLCLQCQNWLYRFKVL